MLTKQSVLPFYVTVKKKITIFCNTKAAAGVEEIDNKPFHFTAAGLEISQFNIKSSCSSKQKKALDWHKKAGG